MKVGHMVSKRFWDNSNRSITDGEMLEIEPRVNGQPLWSTTGEQREQTLHDPRMSGSTQPHSLAESLPIAVSSSALSSGATV